MKRIIDRLFNSEKFVFWLFSSPALIGIFLLIIVPVVISFSFSFLDWDLLSKPEFVGFQNYIDIIKDTKFWYILKNTLVYAFSTAAFAIVIPLLLAALINSKIKGGEFFKTVFFIPYVTPMIVVAIIWAWIFDPNIGFVNHLFKIHTEWLFNPDTAMFVIILVSVWKLIGYNLILLLSGFSLIDESIYEASKIDGATFLKTFFLLTIPLLSPSIFFVSIITFISSFQVFDLIYMMTNGGPEDSTNVLVFWLYKNAFEYFNIGKASAIAYILFAIILFVTFIQWSLRKKWVITEE